MLTTQAQGEIYARMIDTLPEGLTPVAPDMRGLYVVSHSESGHDHVLDAEAVTVMAHPEPPAGMAILYAIVREPAVLRQTASSPHEGLTLAPGIHELRISREHDAFAEQVRRVTD